MYAEMGLSAAAWHAGRAARWREACLDGEKEQKGHREARSREEARRRSSRVDKQGRRGASEVRIIGFLFFIKLLICPST